MSNWLLHGDYAAAPLNLPLLILGLLLAYICGQAVAWVYMATHSGLSYSKSFTNSLVLMPILVSLVMQVLNNNLVTAFGLMAVFAIVRFRNILRDTLDTGYVLAVIVLGMACGTGKFSTAVIGGVTVIAVLLALWYISFGSRHRFDVILNLHWAKSSNDLNQLQRLLERHSLKLYCTSQRSSGISEGTDLSYRVLLRDPGRINDLIVELRDLEGVSRLTSMKAENES
ncbi:MAG TPA: DUF4956 domain-containing protein, partial [Candidatus Baltobacteraceae bacterium]|nr:DUF4956 domain-containing protein [Candidatus Baltobacteraceae bacterium]